MKRQSDVRVLAPRIRLIIPCLIAATGLVAEEPTAAQLFAQGRRAEKTGHMAQAYLFYSEAAAKDPKNENYWFHSQAVRSRASLEVAPRFLPTPEKPDGELPEPLHFESITARDLVDARKPLPPTELSAQPGTRDFDLRANAQSLFETVARAFGLDCVFDGDYQPGNTIHFAVTGADYRIALHALEAATGSFVVPITARLVLVAKDTPQKRSELEPSVAVEVHLSEPTNAQDFTAAITAVQQSLAIEKVSWDTQTNTVVLRDRISKVVPARAMIEELMRPRAQVMIEIMAMAVSRNDMVTYGIDFPRLFTLDRIIDIMRDKARLPQQIAGLLVFGGGKTLMGIGIVDPSLVARMAQSGGRVLLRAELRSVDSQPAQLHVGERYPIMTSTYIGPASYYQGGTVYTPPPSFNFEDLGLSLKVTPFVEDLGDVSLEIDAQFKLLTGASVNGIPVVSNRSLQSKANLKMGEWAAVGGLLDKEEARNIVGLAGLAQIPGLGPLVSTHTRDKSSDEVLILMRPHLVGLGPAEKVTHTFWVGSEARPMTPL